MGIILEVSELPEPACVLGYPHSQLLTFMDPQQFSRLMTWMRGQTQAICEGRIWDHDRRQYDFNECGPHGPVIYVGDVERFILGQKIVDW